MDEFLEKMMKALDKATKEYSQAADCSKCEMNKLCNKCYVDFPEYYEPCEEVIKHHWMYGK